MCGICGELTFDGSLAVDAGTLTSMRERLVHRGPDDSGVFITADRRVGLGFRRLRIIDLSPEANQPMANEDGSVRLVFNGEIYNYRDIRADLSARGHRFRSTGDTEVIVHLYEECGAAFVDRIDGMFAIAIWDGRAKRLVLARDRAGKKPLFYAHDSRRIVFGSEVKALFAHPGVGADIDDAQLPAYFVHGYVPHPKTFYRGVRQVEPGSIVSIDADGRVSSRRYWRLEFPDKSQRLSIPRPEAVERVRTLVVNAVSRRLMSDVPLGAFLSAGIDSTVVVGVMSRLTTQPVKTFTIAFDDPAYDESAAAAAIAERFGTDHTEFRVRPSAIDLIDRLIWHHDGPFGDSSAIPTYLVSELTRSHVTVVLTGDGGDETFGGYLRFRAALAAERMPRAAAPAVRALFDSLPRGTSERHVLSRARRFAQFMDLPLLERLARWNSLFQTDLATLVDPARFPGYASFDPIGHLRGDLERIERYSPLAQMLAANFQSYLPDDLLVKTDRCTMANSIEARAPFLDTALMEYVAALPDELKLDGRVTKVVLRAAFADLIPPAINKRPKTGFGVPLDAWFRGELRDYARDTLLSSSAASRRMLRREAVAALIDEHLSGRANNGHKLWALLVFDRWLTLLPHWTATPERGTIPQIVS